ncbi:hypothetical protein IHQ56_13285 [Methylobacillus flagellatus]|uniref:hypothetical protein n=1 Tax=Methylobacillus flagellatus TaxID=405 RepID=UPI00285392A0|nr:hypothetical protein [Methylobacillus flagellatus]MDR5172797.1 hypothetical protein [Methylobacillus flagellatus]
MQKKLIEQLSEYDNDKSLQGTSSQFRSYCTIRRDLRQAAAICDYTINLHNTIKSDSSAFSSMANDLFLVRAAVMHALILYSRWFKSTKGKPQLQASEYFVITSEEMQSHIAIIKLRDSYLAHNQTDILGGDRIWVELDNKGLFISSYSDWLEHMWLQEKNGLDMAMFRRLIGIVHDRIDAEILPKKQRQLDAHLIKILGKSA